MEESNNIILEMQYEDDTSGKCELLSIFKADNGCDYAALLTLNEDGSVQEGASVELVRVKLHQAEDMEVDYLIEGIDTDEELQTAKAAYERLDFIPVDEEGTSVNDLLTLTFENSEGQMEDWKVVDVFDLRNRKYIALIPQSDAESGDGRINIHLMRLTLTVQNGVEGCEVSSIPSDMEYDEVAKVFEARVG